MTVENPELFRQFGVTGPGAKFDPLVFSNLSTLLQQIQNSLSADDVSGLATLKQTIETIEKKGALSVGDLQTLESELSEIAGSPTLPKPQLDAVNAFISELKTLPPGKLPLDGTGSSNDFLDCSAILELFQMTAKITTELAKIQYLEAMQRVKEMEMQKEAAQEASVLTRMAGQVEAEKLLIQARCEYAQAGIALATGISSATMSLVGAYRGRAAYDDYMEKTKNQNLDPTVREQNAFQASQTTERNWQSITQGVDKVSEATKELYSAAMHQQLSSKEIQEATLKAAAQFLQTLSELQSQAASTLGQSVNSLDQEIKSFFDKYIEAMRAWGQAWGRG